MLKLTKSFVIKCFFYLVYIDYTKNKYLILH